MRVDRISLDGFRNYDRVSTGFDGSVNVIVGDNAQGKTNLLESIFYLTSGRSFRTRFDRDTIGFDRDFAEIDADIFSEGRDQTIKLILHRGKKKEIYVNGVKLKTSSALAGRLTAVLFSPDDLFLIKEGAAVRRRLMDVCISQLRPRYGELLTKYNRIYEHKSHILKYYREKPALLDTLDEFNQAMAVLSAEIIHYRAYFVKKMSEKARDIHREFSDGKEELTIDYKTVSTIPDPLQQPSVLLSLILKRQKQLRQAELESGMCLVGPHKDDMLFGINGREARTFASQGQMRTAALSVKLAEREIHFDDRGEYPILLLDDVLSELDPARQQFVLNRINGGQIFITCCEEGQVERRLGGRAITISKGVIS